MVSGTLRVVDYSCFGSDYLDELNCNSKLPWCRQVVAAAAVEAQAWVHFATSAKGSGHFFLHTATPNIESDYVLMSHRGHRPRSGFFTASRLDVPGSIQVASNGRTLSRLETFSNGSPQRIECFAITWEGRGGGGGGRGRCLNGATRRPGPGITRFGGTCGACGTFGTSCSTCCLYCTCGGGTRFRHCDRQVFVRSVLRASDTSDTNEMV